MDKSLKDSVLDAVDIVELVGERVALRRQGKDFVGLCPFHPDKKPSLAVSPSKRIFKCWSCGAGGDAIKFVQLRDRVDFREALRVLAERLGLNLRRDPRETELDQRREEFRGIMKWAVEYFQRNLRDSPQGQSARHYAESRGLTAKTIATHKIGLAPDGWENLFNAATRAGIKQDILENVGLVTVGEKGKPYDRFRNRLIFPISDNLGRPIAFGGRTLGNDDAKYLNSPESPLFSKSRILYGMDLVRKNLKPGVPAIVVEGYLDAALLFQAGFETVVATLGTALSDAHIKQIKQLTDSVVLCFDADTAGLKAADRAVEISLKNSMDVRVMTLPEGLDPADCIVQQGTETFTSCLQSSISALEFKWSLMEAAVRTSGPAARREALAEFVGFVSRISGASGFDPLERGMLVGRLAALLGIPADAVYALLSTSRSTSRRDAPSTPDDQILSAYDASIRGVPAVLVAVVEELFGWIVTDTAFYRLVDDTVRRTVVYCGAWKRLLESLDALHERLGDVSKADVVEQIDDPSIMELLSRALQRVTGGVVPLEGFNVARRRLDAELGAFDMADMRSSLRSVRPDDQAGENAYLAFLGKARQQNAALAVERRAAAYYGGE